ncbi:hypothetical protein OEZ86_011562 [Tetradesmus obliquus]|nr:hypothetical protein OEZ86_011562 [Tetradesmus obliquus]
MDNIYGSGNTLGQVAELQKQLAEAQSTRFGLDRRVSSMCRQMSDDCSSKSVTFEDALNSHWDCQEAVMTSQDEDEEAYKSKYLRLKARFSKMAQDHIEEVGGLHEEIATLQERLAKTDAARCRALNNEATLAVTLQQTTSQVSTELADLCCENHTLYCENQALMQELVTSKLELAQLSEAQVTLKRELYHSRETNRALEAKMSKLDGLLQQLAAKCQ